MSSRKITSSVAALLMGALGTISPVIAAAAPASAPAAHAQNATSDKRPALVVGIVIDGLDLDCIELLRPLMGDGGFKRLLENGLTITNLDYGTPLDAAAATAVLYTGAPAMVNGVPSSQIYNPETRRVQSVFFDAATIGNYTDETLSPKGLTASTLADELRIDTGGLGYVYAIAPNPETAIVMGAHAGNSAFWINDITGKWATTTHYKDLPAPAQTTNHRRALEYRLDTLQWTPIVAPERLPNLPSYKKLYPFRHTFARGAKNRYKAYKNSPAVNADVTSLAADYIHVLTLGSREATDMLNLSYTLQPFAYANEADTRVELMDSYLRLDRDLERLFKAIDDRGPGMNRTLVFVAGTPVTSRTRRDDEKWGVPFGEFSSKKAVSLLNMYLMALYGNGEWVTGYHNGQIFLNRQLIKDRNHSLETMRRESAQFLMRMSGVTSAWTIDDVIERRSTESPDALRRNTLISAAGDVFVAIAPGWQELDESNAVAEAPQTTIRASLPTAPAFIMAPGEKPQRITAPVDARSFAPTVAHKLRIRAPNGATLPPLR